MKRFANEFTGGKVEKRAKHNAEDLWGDSDPDIEDFLLQASQIVDEIQPPSQVQTGRLENESILSYNGFNKNSMVASTQLDASIWAHPVPSTSTLPKTKHIILEAQREEVQKLKGEVMSKEGEITILRAQLKQSKEQAEQIMSKRTNETLEKLQSMKKEKDKYCTELDFKNLEIANLKQKLANITRNFLDGTTFNDENSTFNNTRKAEITNIPSIKQDICEDTKNYEPVLGTKYPLKSVIPVKMFESSVNDKFPKVLHSKQVTDERYLHSLTFSNENTIAQQCKGVFTFIQYGQILHIKHFFGAIRCLQDATDWQLENEINSIDQIYLLTLTLLTNHLEYLTKFAKLIQKDEVREFDLRNLKNPNRHFNVDLSLFEPINCDSSVEECAMQCRQCVALLAAVYPHNNYLRQLINNKQLQSTERQRETWPYAFSTYFSGGGERNLLRILYRIVVFIADTRRGHLYTGLLCAICSLLTQIVQFPPQDNNKIFEITGKLIMQIVLSTPAYSVFFHLSELLKNGSTCTLFIQQLCRNSKSNAQKKLEKGIVLVNHTCCIIEIYFSLCRQALSHIARTHSDEFRMHLNLVQFVTNSINSNVRWLHIEPDKSPHSCVKEYYKLTIEVIHVSLSTYRVLRGQNKDIPVEVQTIVRIAPNVLGTLVHKYAELIEINLRYNAMLKASQALLKELRDKFDGWSEFEVESIVKLNICEPSPSSPTPSWDELALESLKFSCQ